jgi:hypothetical protein
MYARLLFVVVGIFGPILPILAPLTACASASGGLARPDTADIRFAHE